MVRAKILDQFWTVRKKAGVAFPLKIAIPKMPILLELEVVNPGSVAGMEMPFFEHGRFSSAPVLST